MKILHDCQKRHTKDSSIWRYILVFLLTFATYTQSVAQNVPELIYYKFDIPGTTVTNDASAPVGNNPANVTGLTIGGVGQFGSGLQGSAGATASNRVDPGWTGTHTGSWTISFWMDVATPPTTRYMFGNSSGNGTFRCFIGGAANGIRLVGGVPSITLDMPAWTPGTSVIHYVYDQGAGTVSGYIDGVFQQSVSVGASYPLVGTNFVVGSQGTSIDGTMDEFRMYNRALDAAEIALTWNLPLPGIPCSGAPTAGTASATPATLACAGQSFTLALTGATMAGGMTYQWQSSPTGAGTFNDISGATSSSYTVTNLTADTDYRCVVTCTHSSSSDTSNVVTVTQPSAVGNFSEDFDSTPVGTGSKAGSNYPTCWSYIDSVTTGYGYVIASTPQSSPNTYRLYRTNAVAGVSQELVLISPQTDNLGNGTKQLRFSVRSYGTATTAYINQLEILSMPDPTTTSGATVLATVYNDNTNGQVWKEYIVPLPATTDDYFGFRLAYNGTTTASSVVIDDVYYEDLQPCMYPMNLDVTNVTHNSADVSWDPATDPGVTGYEYEIRDAANNIVASGTTSGTSVSVTTGLNQATDYTAYVRSICGATNGDWTTFSVDFQTLCTVYTANFSEDFDSTPVGTGSKAGSNYPTCWSYIDSVTTGYGYVIASTPQSSPNTYRLYRTNAVAGVSQELVLISPPTDNLGNGTKQLRFSVRSYGTATTAYINQLEILSMPDPTTTSGATVLATVYNDNTNGQVWKEYIVPLPATTDDYFGFRLAYNGTTTASSVVIDDVYYEDLSPCIFPLNIETSNITETTATISWDPSLASGVTGYDYEVRDAANNNVVASGTTTGTSVNVTGLDSGTEYFVYVRSRCGTTPGIWTTFPDDFMTLCDVTGNFYENFDSAQVGSTSNPTLPNCWGYIDEVTTTGYGYVEAATAQSAPNSYRLYRSNSASNAAESVVLISPETDNLGNGTKRVRFSAMATTTNMSNILEVVTSNGQTAGSTFTVLDTIVVNHTNYQEYIVPFDTTTDDYFGFRLVHNGTTTLTDINIDDVYYEDIPPLVVNVDKEDIICYGNDDGSAIAVGEGGVPPYSYSWSPSGATTDTVTNLIPGQHTVTITDAWNDTATATIIILEPTPIVSGLDYTDVICNGQGNGTASVTPTGGTPPYTVLWSDNTIGLTNSNLAPGSYDVTIRDANHCVLTESFTIDEPAALTTSVGNQTNVSTYGGNDGSATVAVTGGTPPYTYTWTPAVSTTDTASALTAGTYTVLVTDANGCTESQVFVITEPAPPYVITLVSKEDVSCNGGNDGSITISVTGPNPPFTYSWAPSGGNGTTASNLTAGTYTVTVTDAVNEVITEDFIITEPGVMSASVGSIVDVSCGGNNDGSATVSVSGGATPYSYTWSNGETTATAVSLTAGNHFVMVTDANGCQVQQSFSIGQPTPIVINTVNITDASCNGQADGAITISVNGGLTPYTYSWSNNQTGTSLSNLTGGTYTVTVTDANGCTETESFTVADPAVVYPPSAVNQGLCSDNNPLLSDVVITGTNIQWYDAATGGNLLPLTTALTNGATYYASQTVDGCESASRTAVQISLYQSVPLTTTNKSVCYNSIIQDVTIDGFNYMQLKWYSSATAPAALPATTLLASGTYYVSSFTNGVCESARQAVQVTVSQGVPAPVVTPQQVCGSGHTLDDLTVGTASGATLIWYASAQTATPLAGTTQALSGTYYVEQVIGTCKSVRVAVSVQVIPVTSPAMTDLTTCSGTTIADFNAQVAPTKYVWYINNTTTTPLAETTVISSGTFYIAEEVSGCISNRAQVDVVVNQRPNQPTGQTVQRVSAGATVADLQMNQQGVIWFGSEADALNFTKQLPSNTPLVHNKKYYGVLVGGNNCASLPTEVEVRITLSTNDLDLTYLKYYPNPTDSELNISYVEAITKVEIFNISGQRVLSKEFDANEVKVDLSGFGSGTYMVRIETETASQFVKVVKK